MADDKTRFRFRKEAELRLLSHHDLARAVERLLRRAQLPFESTGGFHPHPRIVFPLSMPLGTIGLEEIVEIEWKTKIEPEEAVDVLRRHAPPGITFVSARRIPLKSTARCRRVEYQLPIPTEKLSLAEDCVRNFSTCSEIWVERIRPRHKRLDIFPFIDSIAIQNQKLQFSLWVTGNGTAKADEVCTALGLGELLESACWTRSRLEVFDELTPEEVARTPAITAREELLLDRPVHSQEEVLSSASLEWGASEDGPIVE
jgi:radical SAM-linked protein